MGQNVYTVKQINSYIKNMFTQDYMLNRIYVKGEISNCKYHSSQHIYFSIKDASGTIACVMFKQNRAGLSFRLQEGQQVVILGSIDVYERDGRYQLYAKEIRLDGEGHLYEKFQTLKRELEEMGMFAAEYKKSVPKYAEKIGVVTASTGAAVRDIINISSRRNPYIQLILYPALVQGSQAAPSIVNGIHAMEEKNVDVIIVGRGGGSIEDLWAFNEESVARAIFECEIPVISAVGHETDTTIADYVADLRAPTPSAAAELAVFSYQDYETDLHEREGKLKREMSRSTENVKRRIEEKKLRIRLLHPRHKLQENLQRSIDLENRLRTCMEQKLVQRKQQLAICIEQMKRLSPLEKLGKGYAYIQNEQGEMINQASSLRIGQSVNIHFYRGRACAKIEELNEENGYE